MSYFYDLQNDIFYNDDINDVDTSSMIAVSDTDFYKLLNGRAGGGIIYMHDDSLDVTPPRPSEAHHWDGKTWQISSAKLTALLTSRRDALIDQIDSHAAGIYSQWTRFESEYRERKAVAEAYKAANYQGECSRYITDFAKRAGIDNQTATDLILVQAAGLEKLQVELANQRMRKYELKAPGLTLEQMQATYDDIIKNMDNLMEAYKNG